MNYKLLVYILIALGVTMIILSPIRKIIAPNNVLKTAFSTRLSSDGTKLQIIYTGRLTKEDVQLTNADGEKLTLVFLVNGESQEIKFSGELEPYQVVTADIPIGATDYIIYYDTTRIQGGKIV